MRRDKELIKALLLYAEEQTDGGCPIIEVADLPECFHEVSVNDFRQHGKLMMDYGLIEGRLVERGIQITAITWSGYDFLENARATKIWQTAKKAAGHLSWDVFVAVLKQVAADCAKAAL